MKRNTQCTMQPRPKPPRHTQHRALRRRNLAESALLTSERPAGSGRVGSARPGRGPVRVGWLTVRAILTTRNRPSSIWAGRALPTSCLPLCRPRPDAPPEATARPLAAARSPEPLHLVEGGRATQQQVPVWLLRHNDDNNNTTKGDALVKRARSSTAPPLSLSLSSEWFRVDRSRVDLPSGSGRVASDAHCSTP